MKYQAYLEKWQDLKKREEDSREVFPHAAACWFSKALSGDNEPLRWKHPEYTLYSYITILRALLGDVIRLEKSRVPLRQSDITELVGFPELQMKVVQLRSSIADRIYYICELFGDDEDGDDGPFGDWSSPFPGPENTPALRRPKKVVAA